MRLRDSKTGKFLKTEKVKVICLLCNKEFFVKESYSKRAKFCSKKCAGCAIGLKGVWIGRKHTEESKKKISQNNVRFWLNKKRPNTAKKGINSPNWIKDRNLLKDDHRDRNGQLHRYWSNRVKIRDNYRCKIDNKSCSGKLEAHHILGWSLYPELRYEINNGITLCLAHHPRKRAEEKRLIPFFQGLVSVSNSKI